jgi:hypothetical protein
MEDIFAKADEKIFDAMRMVRDDATSEEALRQTIDPTRVHGEKAAHLKMHSARLVKYLNAALDGSNDRLGLSLNWSNLEVAYLLCDAARLKICSVTDRESHFADILLGQSSQLGAIKLARADEQMSGKMAKYN